ncbi:hypothetical protein [Psychrobacter sp.]|uniref:hypothetical protein n=1 Tax=Psychrobacter sp. TaxID=56811 RepID=UPI0025FBC572|nr:hypothetical protein [Psychrobacter sp.]
MKLINLVIFFIIVFALNYVLNMVLNLGQDLTYIAVLSVITTALFYVLTFMRDRWSK